MRIIFIFLLSVFVFSPVASAQVSEDCQTAATSADVMRCLNQNNQNAQNALKDVYKALSLRKSADGLDSLEALQTLWIEYRDRECEAETRALSSQALKRLEGIKCRTRLTRQRIDALQRTLDAETGSAVLGEPPSTQQPRWVNALAEHYQNVYWHYGGFSKGDLDCDDDAEFVIAGLIYDENESVYKTVIAVSENPATGRPHSTLLVLPDTTVDTNPDDQGVAEDVRRCSGIMSFLFDVPPPVMPTDGQEATLKDVENAVAASQPDGTCNRRLIVTRKTSDKSAVCMPVTVVWDGQNYVIEQ